MSGEKEEEAGSGSGEEPKKVLVGEVLPPEKETGGLVLVLREASKQLGAECKAIIRAVIGKAKKGDLPSIKLLLELAERSERAEDISEEEIETLGQMLMREFHALQEDEDGSSGEKTEEKAA